jgi:hypothetical protein
MTMPKLNEWLIFHEFVAGTLAKAVTPGKIAPPARTRPLAIQGETVTAGGLSSAACAALCRASR